MFLVRERENNEHMGSTGLSNDNHVMSCGYNFLTRTEDG